MGFGDGNHVSLLLAVAVALSTSPGIQMYNPLQHTSTENYQLQASNFMSPLPEQSGTMYNEGNPEFLIDQSMYFPAATNYGYYYTGFESPGEWEDHNRVFGTDGSEFQYSGAQTEDLSYVYYPPSYGYAQSPYNPYNPYIPGAMIGVDGQFVGAQQYYSLDPYQNLVTSPGYMPFVQPDLSPDGSFIHNRVGEGVKQNHSSASAAFQRNLPKPTSNQTNSLRLSDEPRQQVAINGSVSSSQGKRVSGSTQSIDKFSNGKVLSHHNQVQVSIPISNSYSNFGPGALGRAPVDKFRPKFPIGRDLNDERRGPDTLNEPNRGPRTNRVKNQLSLKAYTTKVGNSDAHGNIVIHADQYNKDDFPVDYDDAKFFVIKSYSEDDVHKSIKYNVWSSTINGNKKLDNVFEEIQKVSAGKPRACPVFLFFSVNASGQFCGVAEMIGPVEFDNDMEFWQQDKWSGSFPVKWHIIKDIPNSNFRHIILENNENKPVTNSRDTQEIMYKQGLEMLKISKSHTSKTSLLDDFMYYENRQKMLQDEKSRMLSKTFEVLPFPPVLDHTHEKNRMIVFPTTMEKNSTKSDYLHSLKENVATASGQLFTNPIINTTEMIKESKLIPGARQDITSTLKIGSLTINPKVAQPKYPTDVVKAASSSDHKDIGAVSLPPVKANGSIDSSPVLTIGSIPLDPRALQREKRSALPKPDTKSVWLEKGTTLAGKTGPSNGC
ncbi:hypothetical protein ACFE04_007437 [Oxalis oulophora]